MLYHTTAPAAPKVTFAEYDAFCNRLSNDGAAELGGWSYAISAEPVRVTRHSPAGDFEIVVGTRGQPFYNRSAAFGFATWDARQKVGLP